MKKTNTLIETIKNTYKVYTALQIGEDYTVLPALAKHFDSVILVDNEATSKLDNVHRRRHTSNDSYLNEMDYKGVEIDLAYLHNYHTKDFQRNAFIWLMHRKTKFIITHKDAFTTTTRGYSKLRYCENEIYTIFYSDVLFNELEKSNPDPYDKLWL